MKKLIIPAAKFIPDSLQQVGKMPAIIYPINQTIVFDVLYQQYKDAVAEIDVLCYEGKEEVHKRLSMYKNVRIKDLNELNDLGHTVYEALEDEENIVIVNFADTIVMDDISSNESCFFYSQEYLSDMWTFFDENNGKITNVIDKPISSDVEQKKLFVGVFQFENEKYLKECLEAAFKIKSPDMDSFYLAILYYNQKYPMKILETGNWFDIGHAENYYNSKLEVEARTFNHISVDTERGILRKTSDDKDKFIGEILWYLKLPTDLEYVRPRIYSYSMKYDNPYVEMEYYAYHTVHELFLYGNLNVNQWREIFKRILFICNDFKRYTISDEKIQDSLEDMYLKKTLKRLELLKKDIKFSPLFSKKITVNGVAYLSLNEIEDILKKVLPLMLYDVKHFNIIHGDLCFANIMVDNNFSFIKVIDPRGKFGKFDIYGDGRYELAKLFHSIDGKYDYIIKGMFDIEYDMSQCVINYNIFEKHENKKLMEIFLSVFKNVIGNDLKKIELIEALLFLSMVPLHTESLEQQYIMLGTGLQILDRVIDIRA